MDCSDMHEMTLACKVRDYCIIKDAHEDKDAMELVKACNDYPNLRDMSALFLDHNLFLGYVVTF